MRIFLVIGLLVALVAIVSGATLETPSQTGTLPACLKHDWPFKEPFDDDGKFVKPHGLVELEERYAKSESDERLRAQLIQATFELGDGIAYHSAAPPNRKYPVALSLYRAVLALDPTHECAREGKGLIESIYRQLGKPIPQE